MKKKCKTCKHVGTETSEKRTVLFCEHPALKYNEVPTYVNENDTCKDYEPIKEKK